MWVFSVLTAEVRAFWEVLLWPWFVIFQNQSLSNIQHTNMWRGVTLVKNSFIFTDSAILDDLYTSHFTTHWYVSPVYLSLRMPICFPNPYISSLTSIYRLTVCICACRPAQYTACGHVYLHVWHSLCVFPLPTLPTHWTSHFGLYDHSS